MVFINGYYYREWGQYFFCFSMSNDCTFVNNLTKNKNVDHVDENSGETVFKKITDYQLNIKVEGELILYFIVS